MDWRIDKLNEFEEARLDAVELAADFDRISKDLSSIAEELIKGGEFKYINSTEKSTEIRSLLSKRNKIARTLRETVRDLEPYLKQAGILNG